MKSLGLIFAVASLLIFLITTPVNAGVEVLNPYTGIVWNGGETQQITWKENGNSPALTSLKKLTITLMTGTQESQFPVVVIASNVDGTSLSYSYTVPKNVGPEGSSYFLKFSQDTNLYFSGDFTIKGVSGKVPNFSSTGAVSGTSTDSSSSTGTSTATTSLNSTKTSTSTKTGTTSTLTDLTTSTKTGDAAKSNSGPTTTQSPVAKSSSGNNLMASVSTLSITLFAIAFYLF
ncbi:2363_t:CDS:2 [Acaulospora morrowiae]|uniref:2363_t:CDS:1 n=1 Tax=Acaulospora morrowiae TaxID=94023 RepID=A0A9N9GG55_9GLOM|nr:2363_t:CDS:2 [Acaulospora morrowiae]